MIVIVSITMFIISSSIIVRRPVPSTSNVCIDARCIRTSHVSTSDGRSISSRDFSARPVDIVKRLFRAAAGAEGHWRHHAICHVL